MGRWGMKGGPNSVRTQRNSAYVTGFFNNRFGPSLAGWQPVFGASRWDLTRFQRLFGDGHRHATIIIVQLLNNWHRKSHSLAALGLSLPPYLSLLKSVNYIYRLCNVSVGKMWAKYRANYVNGREFWQIFSIQLKPDITDM